MIGFERNTCENAANGSGSSNNLPPPGRKCLKRMAQETGDQSKKRRKWIENLSVLSSEDEEEFAYTAASRKKEKQSIFENNKAIYLRFPYYMGSDNSDDEDEIKYFPDTSPKKREKRVVSSSDEMNEISQENKSYKHTKRKQKSNRYEKKREECRNSKQNISIDSVKKQHKLKSGPHNDSEENATLNNKENKESSKRVLKCKYSKSAKTRPVSEKSKNSKPHSLKSSSKTIDFPTAVNRSLGDNIKKAHKNTSFRQSKAKAFGSVTCENLLDGKEEDSNVAEQKNEEFHVNNHNSSRFLDSSSENSNTENLMTKKTTYRRVKVLSTSSSSSDNEDNPKISDPQNLKQSENPCSYEVKSKSFSKPESKLKPTASISSEEENYDYSLFEPLKGKSEKVFKLVITNDPAESTNSGSVGSNFQTKPTINANAWKSIAIADIKAQFNKQSKVEELKRKLVSSNASSVAIYKKIQKREMLRNKTEQKKPISRPKLYQHQGFLHNNEKNSCEVKLHDIPSTSASQKHDQNLVDSTLNNQIMESSDSKNCKSTFHSSTPERSDSLAEKIGENAEKLLLPQFDLHFDSSPLGIETDTSIYSKKMRQAHNKGLKSQKDHKKLNTHLKISNQNLKHIQSSKENKSKELSHISDDASKNFDVLGDIMSQMDKNRFKIQKPAIKKTEPTTEMLAWFPAGTNASLCGQTQNATGLQQPRMDELQLKHNMPIGMPLSSVNKTTFVTSNTLNPSYNPLCTAAVSSSNINQTGIEKHANVELKNKEVLRVSKSKQTSKIEENALVTTSESSSGGKFVPFYSAPQEDYEGEDIRSKNKIANGKSSIVKRFLECKSDNQSSSSNNKPSYSDNNKGNGSSLEGLSKNTISQEPRVSQLRHNNKDSFSSAVDKSEKSNHLAERTTNTLRTNKSNSGKSNLEPTKHSEEPLKVGLLTVESAICNEFKKDNSNINNNDTPKGIRVRIGRTEFRLSRKTSGNLATKDGGVSEGQSEAGTAGQTSSSNVKDLTTVSDKVKAQKSEVVKSMANETGEAPVKAVSSSSTTSSSSLNNSSSSSDDSSSESSDECLKPNSVEGSASDSRSNSPGHYILKDPANIDKSNISFQTEDIQSQINTQVQAQDAPTDKKDLSLQPVQDPLSCSKMKAKYSLVTPNNKSNVEVITLSGSSDSDSNDVLQYKGIDPQLPGKVGQIEKPFDNRVGLTEELANVNTASQAEKSELKSDKVGKIRVKSLKELGVIHDNHSNENALEPMQINDVSQAESKEQQKKILEVSQAQIKEQQKQIRAVSQAQSKKQQKQIRAVSQAQSKEQQNQIRAVSQAQSKEQQKQMCEVPQAQSKEHQKSQLDPPSFSTANTVNDKFIHQLVTNFLSSDKTNSDNQLTPRRPETSNLSKDMLVKKPITTIFLPVVPIAVINPANSVRVMPIVSSLNQEKNKESNLDPGSGNSSHVEPSVSSQTIASGSAISSNQETSRNPAELEVMPSPSIYVQRLFFKLCDELFTEVVLFKIPKLADELHLVIACDIMKEERLKKIDQLINLDTRASEKRRAEKEFADTIKSRGQSFVPLFMTIVKKIHQNHLKALLMAVYFRIVQQVERIDPVNGVYRYKIKDLIKSMLLKNRVPDWDLKQDILTYFEAEIDLFLSHFRFIEDLSDKYDHYVVERQTAEVQNKNNAIETSQPHTETPESSQRINEGTDSSASLHLSEGPAQSSNVSGLNHNQTSDQTHNMPAQPPPPSIGNLDQVFLKRNRQKK